MYRRQKIKSLPKASLAAIANTFTKVNTGNPVSDWPPSHLIRTARYCVYWCTLFWVLSINHQSHYFQSHSLPCAQSMITMFVPVKYQLFITASIIDHNSSKIPDQSSITASVPTTVFCCDAQCIECKPPIAKYKINIMREKIKEIRPQVFKGVGRDVNPHNPQNRDFFRLKKSEKWWNR